MALQTSKAELCFAGSLQGHHTFHSQGQKAFSHREDQQEYCFLQALVFLGLFSLSREAVLEQPCPVGTKDLGGSH